MILGITSELSAQEDAHEPHEISQVVAPTMPQCACAAITWTWVEQLVLGNPCIKYRRYTNMDGLRIQCLHWMVFAHNDLRHGHSQHCHAVSAPSAEPAAQPGQGAPDAHAKHGQMVNWKNCKLSKRNWHLQIEWYQL